MVSPPASTTLTGVLERIIFLNEENHYTIAELRPDSSKSAAEPAFAKASAGAKAPADKPAGGPLVTIVGALPGVQCGETLALTGEWTRHAQHGAQFKIATCESRLPASVYGIRRYLGSGLISGIGRVYADKIVAAFGADTFRVLSEESGKLRQVPGIGKVRAASIKAAWEEQKILREMHIFLQTHGVTTSQCVRIVKKLGAEAQRLIKTEAYILAREVEGIGFKTADRIAINLGFANDAAPRLDAGLVYALQTLEEDGHTAFPRGELVAYTANLLETSAERIEARINALLARKDLVQHGAGSPPPLPSGRANPPNEPFRQAQGSDSLEGPGLVGTTRTPPSGTPHSALRAPHSFIQLPHNDRAESKIAGVVSRLNAVPSGLPAIKIDSAVTWAQEKAGIEFHELQQAAIKHALAHKFSILTGGPGTGKAQPLHATVLTPAGFRAIGELRPGDEIITPEGTVVLVRSIHPQGIKPVYRVNFSDGRSCECCGDHLWKIWTRTSVWSPTKRKKVGSRGWRVVPLSYVQRRLSENLAESDRMGVPLLTPCASLPDIPLPCDPYVLGALIGDGNLRDAVLLTTTDPELREHVASLVAPLGVRLKPVTLHGASTIGFRLIAGGKGRPNPLRDAIKQLGLAVNSEAKFIPPLYFKASAAQRMELLRGLLDTDGTVDKLGNVSFTSCSFRLAKDFQKLAWSLGCIATLGATRKTTFTYRGEKRSGRDACVIFVQHPEPAGLFFLSRKQRRTIRHRPRKRIGHRVRITAVEPLAPQECVCISIDSPSGLYITDDYVVTHNTTILRALVDILKAKKARVTLAAPTGRAAQRLAGTTGGFASTIHRLLAFDHVKGGFQHNESKPLATDFLIVDETSMLDTRLAAALLQAVPVRAHLLLVGDTDQLPSVGAGNVLKDLIAVATTANLQPPTSNLQRGRADPPDEPFRQARGPEPAEGPLLAGTTGPASSAPSPDPKSKTPDPKSRTPDPVPSQIPVTRLRFVYRQQKESLIVTAAHAINGGETSPPPAVSDVSKAQAWSDLNFIAAHSAEDCLAKIIELCTRFIPQHFKWLDPVADVQVLAPMHKGVVGVSNLNAQLQAALRPWKMERGLLGRRGPGEGGRTRPAEGMSLKTVSGAYEIGDKLIQLRNNYDKDLFNGDIGTVLSVDPAKGTLLADFDGGKHVFERGDFGDLALAFCISIHKSQGSEYPVVIVPLLKAHFIMLQRNLIYTAITRGRKKVFIVGEPAAYGMAVRNAGSKFRCTHLREKILNQ